MRLELLTPPALRLTLSALALASLAACAHFDNEAPKAQLLDAAAVGLQGEPAQPIAADWWRGLAQTEGLVAE